jgi:serine/threonine-protein kinase
MMETTDDWFERYRFRQPLGQGGMGITYLAEDRTSGGKECVVKQMISKAANPKEHHEAIRLFEREAAILRSLNHPGIVRFFDNHVTEDSKYFLVMEYVKGQDLASILKTSGSFDSESTIEIAIQCCEVLEYLHDQEPPIIYRDLKPSNLILTPEGVIIFVDFGIARSFLPTENATRVVTGGYSPPEQYFGKPEVRSDLYSLGATLSELLTGIAPKALTISNPKKQNSKVLASLDNLISHLTATNPEDRPLSAKSVRADLYRIYKGIHPEFEIPEDLPSGTTETLEAQNSRKHQVWERLKNWMSIFTN